ncbi:MAG: TlpA family protein disulfide reductase [Arenimonas sp.]
MRFFIFSLCLLFSISVSATPKKGEAAPNLLGKDGKGGEVTLEQFKGKVVVVTFWATWCGYCLKELPALNHIQNSVGTDYIQIVAVNQKEDLRTAQTVMRQLKDRKLLSIYDGKGKISESYGVRGLPNLWIIAPDGTVAAHHIGYGEDALSIIAKDILRVLEKYNPDLAEVSN